MCGIVGHVGLSNSIDIVLEGLKRLEYRGYDSSGISFKNDLKEIEIHKKVGKLENLKREILPLQLTSHACIGHTRWATHGEVSEANAHPHFSDVIEKSDDRFLSLVHNGIIENHAELREKILSRGVKFRSQTDSEVFLCLVELELLDGNDLYDAVFKAFSQVRGNSAFVIMMKGSNEIVAIKRGAPLVLGTYALKKDAFVSSDPYALVGMVDQIYFPEDNVLCSISLDHQDLVKFFESDKKESSRYKVNQQEITLEAADKGKFEHFMLKEIFEQPTLIRNLAQYYAFQDGAKKLEAAKSFSPSAIHISACGTAWHAGLVIKNFIESINRIQTNVELASEFRYRDPILKTSELGLFISQSGETADTLAAQSLCKQKGLTTYSIVNTEGSTLYRECDLNLMIKAGMEIGVASTKAFTLQALTGYLLALAYKGEIDATKIGKDFNLLAERIEELLNRADEIKKVAEEIHNYHGYIFTGRGIDFPIALEGALKLKEIAYVHAEGYAAGELKHGPIALIDDHMVNIALISGELYEKTFSNIQEVKARKGIVVAIGPQNDKHLEDIADYYIPMNYEGLGVLRGLYTNVATQLLAYYMAKFLGTDIDKPRNLAKSVTVE